jgi:hypothetical protein
MRDLHGAVRDALLRWRDEEGDVRTLGLVRVAFGLLLLWNAVRAARELAAGYFGDVFHWSILPEALVPSRGVYVAIVAAQIALALVVVAGPRSRDALLASALLGGWVLLCDRLGYHHNRYALFAYAAILAFAPCDRSFRIGPAPGPPVGPLWAARLAQLQISIVYLASAGAKLLDADWRGGQVLLERFHLYGDRAVAAGVPASLVAWAARPQVTGPLALLAIATELFLAAGLWSRRTRVFALWWGVWFHFIIEASSRVEGFTWLTLAVYALFVTPEAGARRLLFDAGRPAGRAAAHAVAALDWFARFEISATATAGRGVVVERRDGTRSTGLAALAMVARCTPLLFPLWAPLAVAARVARRWVRPT